MTSTAAAEPIGFTTTSALNQLCEDIENLLGSNETKLTKESFFERLKCFFTKPFDIPIGWFPIALTWLTIVGLCAIGHYAAATALTFICVATMCTVLRENDLRRSEMHRKVRSVVDEIRMATVLCKDWTPDNYPNLCCPLSPCVTLQWTYRDGAIVNLPWALLVKGDTIIMRPGQVAPGDCEQLNGKHAFEAGQTYGLSQPTEPPLRPTARAPMPDLVCIMLATPYLENLKTALDNFLKRPPTIYNQQRYLLVTKCIQQFGSVLALCVTIVFGLLRYVGILFPNGHWTELFIEIPVCALLPILPLMFPFMWIAINLWGIARLQTLLAIPQSNLVSDEQKSFAEDLDTPTYDWEKVPLPARQVFRHWCELWRGDSQLLARSANVVQVLGSITALSCVDKKGILSWPNPTAEKVFFIRDENKASTVASVTKSNSSLDSDVSCGNDDDDDNDDEDGNHQGGGGGGGGDRGVNNKPKGANGGGAVAEVLDLTHDQHSAFRLEFDDHEWKEHITSLKPLGLAILVNTCCPLTQVHYAQFCGHVTAVAMFDKDLVPVTNRYAIVESRLNSFMHGRCLCELAKQIGFSTNAREIFNLEGQIASYMHLQPDVVRRDIRFARQLQLASKVKVPFPHCLSVVMREAHSGSLQLLTQGTADIVLDCCDDFWDGKDLRPLGSQERKRAQDFYQRSALTAYCTAFAYRPLRHGISGALAGVTSGNTAYLELPPEAKYRMAQADPHPFNANGPHHHHPGSMHHSISTDSLLFNDNKEDDITDVDGCFEMQCHQVFIGMVTMQYQAQLDIVQLIERLDRACVRFVHFSKENELRSRVFSEKMGLESGWNCHISLLSKSTSSLPSPKSSRNNCQSNGALNTTVDIEIVNKAELNLLLPPSGLEASKNLSSSAPGAISNPDCSLLQPSPMSIEPNNSVVNIEMQHRASKDSAMEDENCRSLSCLTDSTEQSAPINFDMSNRAKLPRGIENIQPHLENVDNVPLLVSLFTDCSAEATREMLGIMQKYGEIVVCIGSSASNANAEIFLQADCGIAIEPLYPQVCQDIPAYTEANILNNRLTLRNDDASTKWLQSNETPPKAATISPIYLSRMLNAISCSISICRDDSLSIVSLVELSRRFSNGLWSCIQFWACCGCSVALMNTVCAGLSLPPLMTPLGLIYVMCVVVPALAATLVRTDPNQQVMNRATGKKQTTFDSNVFFFVLWCYGCKFLPTTLIMILSYCTFMSHPISVLDNETPDFSDDLNCARSYILLAVVIHFVCISMSFVHRDFSIWRKNPFLNLKWTTISFAIIFVQLLFYTACALTQPQIDASFKRVWPIVLFLFASVVLVIATTEICKWEELKVNTRYQRRARLDFGTKLGMNSPF